MIRTNLAKFYHAQFSLKIEKKKWIFENVITGLFWGVWGIVAKINTELSSPFMNHVLFTVGMLFTVLFLRLKNRKNAISSIGFKWAFLARLMAVAGN